MVKVKGQIYRGVQDIRKHGGPFDYSERSRKRAILPETAMEQPVRLTEERHTGEHVYVLFLEGDTELPVIIGGADHPLRQSLATLKDNEFMKEVFNGIEFTWTTLGDFLIRVDGLKQGVPPAGVPVNPTAINSRIMIRGTTGDIEFSTQAPPLPETPDTLTTDVRIKMDKTLKQLEMYAQLNEVKMDAQGISIKDKNQNEVKMDAQAVTMKAGPAGTEFKMENSGKFKMTNGVDEIVDLLSQVTDLLAQTNQALATTITATFIGPQPLLSAPTHSTLASTLNTIKGKLDALKGT